MQSSVTLTVRVFDVQRRPIEAAQVEPKEAASVRHRGRGVFTARGVAPGRAQLRVPAPGLQGETRLLAVGATTRRVDMILGARGLPADTKGGVRVPDEPHPRWIALRLRHAAKGDPPARAAQMAAVMPWLQGLLDARAVDARRLLEWGIDVKALRKCACSKPRRVRGELGIARRLLGGKTR